MMSRAFTFFAAGEPKGQPRPRAVMRHGTGGRLHAGVFDPGTADNWKACVKLAAQQAGLTHTNLAGPVSVTLRFFMPRPAAHFKGGDRVKALKESAPQWHTGKPDRDNLEKAVLDALTDCGVWLDDGQVCAGENLKIYATGRVGCEITITALSEAPARAAVAMNLPV